MLLLMNLKKQRAISVPADSDGVARTGCREGESGRVPFGNTHQLQFSSRQRPVRIYPIFSLETETIFVCFN